MLFDLCFYGFSDAKVEEDAARAEAEAEAQAQAQAAEAERVRKLAEVGGDGLSCLFFFMPNDAFETIFYIQIEALDRKRLAFSSDLLDSDLALVSGGEGYRFCWLSACSPPRSKRHHPLLLLFVFVSVKTATATNEPLWQLRGAQVRPYVVLRPFVARLS